MERNQYRKMTKAQEDAQKDTQAFLQAGYRDLIHVEVPVLFKPTDEELRKCGVSEEDIDRYNGRGGNHPNEDECGHDTRPTYVGLCNQQHFDRLSHVSHNFNVVIYVTSLILETPSF